MECPKCGAPQDDGRQECSACGIVFERWRNAQVARAPHSFEAPRPPEPQSSIPKPLIAAAVIIFVLFGIVWTAQRRAARNKQNAAAVGDEMLDRINNRGTKTRERLAEEAKRARRLQDRTESSTAEPPRPVGFSETDATTLLNRCSGFAVTDEIRLPKSYSADESDVMLHRYPHLRAALRDNVVLTTERAEGVITHRLATRALGMGIHEHVTEFVIPIGPRVVESITSLTGTTDRATARFSWEWRGRVAAEILRPESSGGTGDAQFRYRDGGWKVIEARITQDSDSKNVCP